MTALQQAYIVAATRTPIGRSHKGYFRNTRPDDLLATALRSLDRDVIAERLRLIATEDVSAELQGLRIPIVLAHFKDDLVVGGGWICR